MIVVDTNVVSELMRADPSVGVVDWVGSQDPRDLHTTAITVAEIRYGIEQLPGGQRRDLLTATVAELFASFAEHVLPFDHRAAAGCGRIVADRERAGSPIRGFGAQIAAICQTHGAVLASRNGKDFLGAGVEVVDPWLG